MGMNRNTAVVTSVLLFHVGALWALQSGLLRRVVEQIIPAQVVIEFMSTPEPTPPKPQPKPAPLPQPVAKRPAEAPVLATTQAAAEPSLLAPAPVAAAPAPTIATAPAQPAPASTPRLELPSSDADYLNNPKPAYPPLSRRLGEQGKVVIRALIGTDGSALEANIQQSSGFDRLDQAALSTARKWRYVPGKRAGVAEAMWFNLPFNFVLE